MGLQTRRRQMISELILYCNESFIKKIFSILKENNLTEYIIMEMLKARSVKLTDSFLTPNFEDICWEQSDENYSSKSPENYLKTCSSFLENFNVYFLSACYYYTEYSRMYAVDISYWILCS